MKARIKANGVQLYASHTYMSPIVGQLANGEEVELEGEYGCWVKVKDLGWVKAAHTEAIELDAGGVTSWNDLEDKPFGEEVAITEVPWHTDVTFSGDFGFFFDEEHLSFDKNNTYRLILDGVVHEGKSEDGAFVRFTQETYLYANSIRGGIDIYTELGYDSGEHTASLIELQTETTVIPLDAKYLPNTTIVNITVADDETVTSDVPSNEVAKLMLSGVNVMCCYDGRYACFSEIGLTRQGHYIPTARFWSGETMTEIFGNLLSDDSDGWYIVETTFATE